MNSQQSAANASFGLETERIRMLSEWDAAPPAYPRNTGIHEIFEQHAADTPDAIALVLKQRRWTYRELNRNANQLAHYLQTIGVGHETLVGLGMERSFEMIVGLLGILKAGGAYVPLDPAYPEEQLSFMLADTGLSVLLTQQRFAGKFALQGLNVVCLDADWEARIEPESEDAPVSTTTADNLAYIMYTSGSTGKPKGSSIIHRGVVRLVKAANYAQLNADEVFLQLAPISFDASTFEIWGALLNGARLVLMPAHPFSLEQIGRTIANAQVTIVWLTAGLFHRMVEERLDDLRAIRQLLAGGDVLSAAHVQKVLQHLPECTLINGYGPTENTTFTCCYTITAHPDPTASIPIGRPIAHTHVYILNQALEPVPIGEVGELYAGGDGLARDYFRRPALTAEKFIPNPFSAEPGARLYKTGDLARYRPDGNLEFLGRRDRQVKIRGFRVELDEIETTLAHHPKVNSAVVLAREDAPGEKRLIAYVVCKAAHGVETLSSRRQRDLAASLRNYLRQHVPEYMLPANFVFLENLPLTPNGKIDRLALPAPDQVPRAECENGVAPATSTEHRLARIWAEMLHLEQVDIHEDFFECGGDSLLAVKFMAQVNTAFRTELPAYTLFERFTIASLALAIERLRHARHAQRLPMVPVSRHGLLPLSFPQQQLWFLCWLHPDQRVYHETCTLRPPGAIDVAALEQSLTELSRRHEILRTTFPVVDGQPFQRIHPPGRCPLQNVDLRNLPEAERETEARRLATDDARQPFDLCKGPLWRMLLIRIAADDVRLFLTIHHLITDGVSLYDIFLPELETIYRAYAAGKPSPLPEPTLHYADFAVWQRDYWQADMLAPQLAYWTQKLADLPELQLPTDRPRTANTTFRGSQQCLALSKRLTTQLKNLGRQEGATLFMILVAAVNVLLRRYSSQADFAIGTASAGRNRPEIETLMGYFLNILVLRTDMSGNPTFRTLLRRVHDTVREAFTHQDVPFDQVVAALQPQRRLGQNPLFQVALILEPRLLEDHLEWTLSQLDVHAGASKFDLTFELDERQEGVIGRIQYNADLFDDATITRMIGHFQTILEGLVRNPDQRVADLPLLTEAERRQVVWEWNALTSESFPPPGEQCLHHHVEAQAGRTPEAVALVFEHQQMTYWTLNARTNQLAHYLRQRGVGPDVLVGLCVERSVEMVLGMLGILKAGGTYVPLDPHHPKERLRFMAADTAVSIVLTQARWRPMFSEHHARIMCLDADWNDIAQEPGEIGPSVSVGPENLAYVLYTSGSTGAPKGTLITHGAICNHMRWMQTAFPLSPADVVLQKTPFTFDASVWEFWAPLFSGAQLVMADPDGHRDPADLIDAILAHKVTVLQVVPALLRALLDYGGFERCRTLKRVFCGGEMLARSVCQDFWAQQPADLINLYGPTEACIDATFWVCRDDLALPSAPIGRPIANMQAYVVDPALQPVPVGVPGELLLSGAGLARGYWHQPALTAERFLPNPFAAEMGTRLYRTGDLCRYLPDGNLEFLGRQDDQVKLRGFRIELGEIETALKRHPDIHAAVVVLRDDPPHEKRIVAYLVASHLTGAAVRNFLTDILPAYMIPAAFVLLDALPVTPHGKLDRNALPVPEAPGSDVARITVAPRTPLETQLAEVWAEVLHCDAVGIDDNFFELGGHSLQAAQLAATMSTRTGRKFAVKDIFVHPTIRGLAETVTAVEPNDIETFAPDSVTTPASPAPRLASAAFLRIEARPLLALLAVGDIAPLDAAAIGYLSHTQFASAQPVRDWFGGLPIWTHVLKTSLGRTAILCLPCFDIDLYREETKLLDRISHALKMSAYLGARVVSLTGLIPSATDYGRAVQAFRPPCADFPAITTGHATTAAAVVMNIAHMLTTSRRDLTQERVGVLGVGSIGRTTLHLMLACLPHPREILLCDLYSKVTELERMRQHLSEHCHFHGSVRILQSHARVPGEFYAATMIIGATNVPDVLEIPRLNPGTLIIDDSGPHCFNPTLAMQRFEKHHDILFSEGGVLKSPEPIHEIRYLPADIMQRPELRHLKHFIEIERPDPFTITGCVLSGLLSASDADIGPTVGSVAVEMGVRHYEKLVRLGFQAADLHCEDYFLPDDAVRQFSRHFGAPEPIT